MNKSSKNTDRYIPIITSMLRDVQKRHVAVYTPDAMALDEIIIIDAIALNGMDVLTKHLPALGKAFDRALTEQTAMSEDSAPFFKALGRLCITNAVQVDGSCCITDLTSQLPILFRSLFQRVFTPEGTVLPNSDVDCVISIRQLCFTFYKLELPYALEEEQKVIDQFIKTENDISSYNKLFGAVADSLDYDASKAYKPGAEDEDPSVTFGRAYSQVLPVEYRNVIRDARRLLMRLFQHFDPKAIVPKHGPGAVSSGERLWGKFMFKRINPRIDECYPFCEYFLASGGALVDNLWAIYGYSKYTRTDPDMNGLMDDPVFSGPSLPDTSFSAECMDRVAVPVNTRKGVRYETVPVIAEYPAKVILVPKNSGGPRLISCEPLENQWIQQGLGEAIVRHVETQPLTRHNVHFTDQEPNRRGALIGSIDGRYATLDLKEASDRVTVGLVRLLFPEPLLEHLLAVRTTSTVLPSGQLQNLDKYAPMGSALCFPVMALTIWALLTARFRDDAHARQSMLVYGDDVIVPGYQALNAISTLEAFGLAINRAKSCFTGRFRESCGKDSFKGTCCTPVKLRTLWTSRPSPSSYLSYIAYANEFRRKGYIQVSEEITKWLCRLYGEVPCKDMMLNVPALDVVPEAHRPRRSRTNKGLQKTEYYVRIPRARNIKRVINGWTMLLRYFSETSSLTKAPGLYMSDVANDKPRRSGMEPLNCVDYMIEPFSVRSYTPRDSVVLEWSWR